MGAIQETAEIGIIGGSGLYQIDAVRNPRWVPVDTPWGKPSDEFLLGEIGGVRVAFLPRHARGHRILPSELNHRANIYAMKLLGVQRLISLSAVGSLKEDLAPGTFVLPWQFFDRTKQSANHTFFGNGIAAHVSFAHPVCGELQQALLPHVRAGGPSHLGGTYVNMEGPAFSTLAEAHENRRRGFDIIGMTNLGEAKCAREAGICYVTVAMVTDFDCWHQEHGVVSVERIVDCLNRNAERARALVAAAVPAIPKTSSCKCAHSLHHAILTAREHWPAETVARLDAILRPYL